MLPIKVRIYSTFEPRRLPFEGLDGATGTLVYASRCNWEHEPYALQVSVQLDEKHPDVGDFLRVGYMYSSKENEYMVEPLTDGWFAKVQRFAYWLDGDGNASRDHWRTFHNIWGDPLYWHQVEELLDKMGFDPKD